MTRVFFVVFIITIWMSPVFAQLEYVKRFETELKDDYVGERVLEFGKDGLFIRSSKKEKVNGKRQWRAQKFNADIEEKNTIKWSVDKKYFLDETFSTEDKHFMLYQDKNENFILGNIDIQGNKFEKVTGSFPKKSSVNHMVVMGDYTYSKAYIKKEPVLFIVNWKTGKQNYIPVVVSGYKRKEIEVRNLQVLEEANEVLLYIRAIDSKKSSDLFVLRMDGQGKKISQHNLTKNIDNNIATISAYQLDKENYFYTGTYSEDRVSTSQGLFFSKSSNGKVDFIEFYNFLDLDNFLSYLPEKKEKKIEKKKKRKEAKGKEFKINYRIAAHDIIEVEGGYLYMGEAYYPTYRRESYTRTTVVNGVSRTVTDYRTVFDGYQYTHAVITKFDDSGKLVWDRTFEMYQAYKPFYVKRFIHVSESDSQGVKFAFASRNSIFSKYVDYSGQILKEEQADDIETKFEGDKTKRSVANLSYWYDNYFIAYGRQKIKNTKNDSVDRKRKILFINKVKY